MITTDRFVLDELLFVPMGNHNPMYSRPYIINPTVEGINTIANRLYDTKSPKVTTNILGDVTNSILQRSSVGFGSIIDSNWVSNRRYIFLLKVRTFSAIGDTVISYIQGYTDYDGITDTGNIDGNLVMYINTVIETIVVNITTPYGTTRRERLFKIYNVLSSEHEESFSQRPIDVMYNIETLQVSEALGDYSTVEGLNMLNYMSPFTNNTVSSTVDNNIASEYLSRLLTTGLLNAKSKEIHLGSYEITEQNTLNSKLPEPSISDNRFIKYINSSIGYSMPRDRFTFNSLMGIDETIYNRFKVINLTKEYSNPITANTPEVGEYWTGQDPVTVKAHSLIESSVSMATKYGFNKMIMTASNMSNPLASAEIFITNFNSFMSLEEEDFNYLLEIFKSKFISDIFLPESNGGTLPTHMEIYVDLLGTSKIYLDYAGFPPNWYTIPTTANKLYSPVVTVNHNAFNDTVYNVSQIIDTISNISQTEPNYY